MPRLRSKPGACVASRPGRQQHGRQRNQDQRERDVVLPGRLFAEDPHAENTPSTGIIITDNPLAAGGNLRASIDHTTWQNAIARTTL